MPQNTYDQETGVTTREYDDATDIDTWVAGPFVYIQSEHMEKPLAIPLTSAGDITRSQIQTNETGTSHILQSLVSDSFLSP